MFYVFPIIHADFRYIDDNWRSLLLDYDQWRDQGRMLLEYTLTGLSLVPAKVNMFPLPLFVSIGVMAAAMASVTMYFFLVHPCSPVWCFYPCYVIHFSSAI
jgi:hypothetical protein